MLVGSEEATSVVCCHHAQLPLFLLLRRPLRYRSTVVSTQATGSWHFCSFLLLPFSKYLQRTQLPIQGAQARTRTHVFLIRSTLSAQSSFQHVVSSTDFPRFHSTCPLVRKAPGSSLLLHHTCLSKHHPVSSGLEG